jgi:hypothetical protein
VAPNDVITATAANVVDAAGNAPSGEVGVTAPGFIDTSIVVFDLVNGVSSSHSGRTFDASVSYTIYLVVDAESRRLSETANESGNGTWGDWSGGDRVGLDDKVVLVSSDGAGVRGGVKLGEVQSYGTTGVGGGLAWMNNSGDQLVFLGMGGTIYRDYGGQVGGADIWSGDAAFGYGVSGSAWVSYGPELPQGVLSSQGLGVSMPLS